MTVEPYNCIKVEKKKPDVGWFSLQESILMLKDILKFHMLVIQTLHYSKTAISYL